MLKVIPQKLLEAIDPQLSRWTAQKMIPEKVGENGNNENTIGHKQVTWKWGGEPSNPYHRKRAFKWQGQILWTDELGCGQWATRRAVGSLKFSLSLRTARLPGFSLSKNNLRLWRKNNHVTGYSRIFFCMGFWLFLFCFLFGFGLRCGKKGFLSQ